MMQRTAPAKINLGLHVLRKRADGFHDIETVFVRIPWADVLSAGRAEDVGLTCSDDSIPNGESNLVMRAARELRRQAAPSPSQELSGAVLHLEKHLPAGAGLGGGSSDAAAALLLLNDLWKIGASAEELAKIAARIGSDVPFFLGPECAIGTGRGEELEALDDPETGEPYRPPYPVVVAVPPLQVATAEAYGMVAPRAENRPSLGDVVLSNDLERWRRELTNDFEEPVFERYPAIKEVKTALRAAGAGYASLSGSGAAVYAFFEDERSATGAAEALRESGHRVWHGRI